MTMVGDMKIVGRIKKGETSQVISLVIGAFVAAVLLPIAINQIVSTSTTNWNPAVATVFSVLLPVLVMVAVVLRFLPKKK